VQEEMVEPGLEVNRVRRGYPHRRTIAGLAPHAHGTEAVLWTFFAEYAKNGGQQVSQLGPLFQRRLRQPAQQRLVVQTAAHRRQDHDGCGIVVV